MKVKISLLNVFAACLTAAACTQTDSSADAPKRTATQSASPLPLAKANYVGLLHEGMPRGFTYRGGAAIGYRPPSGGDYVFARVATPKGEMIWLDSLAPVRRSGMRPEVVRASLVIPPLAADERLFMASCDAGGKLDEMVVAIAVNENATRFTKIRQAWRADLGASRFDVIPVDGVVCEDPGSR